MERGPNEEVYNAIRIFISAVQHERGPRKPKVQQNTNPQMQHPPVSSAIQHLAMTDAKMIPNTNIHFPPGIFAPSPHHLKTLTLPPPPPPVPNSPTQHVEGLPPPLFHPQALPPPPGLLHILMSAEKCQNVVKRLDEIIWSSKMQQSDGTTEATTLGLNTGLTLQQPNPSLALPLAPTWEMLQETTARLLFMAVRWVRCLAPFQTLSKHDQLLLLQESWKELFLLHLAQWSVPWDLSALLGCTQARDRLPSDIHTATEIKTIQLYHSHPKFNLPSIRPQQNNFTINKKTIESIDDGQDKSVDADDLWTGTTGIVG
ncbi:nuclear hormone receptor [Holotrichia oblita]|uniref:Nuclear hormone receptor n=1 Tax=Holotrichia oblita TaxID=644536 RepID=A0ACB9SX96_HOLOL|nr:nuclear hormone receptor [Holotrichia oblita]